VEYFVLEQKMFTTQNTVAKIIVVLPLEIHVEGIRDVTSSM
jgi:hypothetical protein